MDEDRLLLCIWTTLVSRQGMIVAHLSVVPPTRAELITELPRAVSRAPAWIDAQVHDLPMTWRIFFTGLAQTAAVHRKAIERVVSEQVSDPEPIEQVLAESPVPPATEDEARKKLMSGVVQALLAHTKALVDIAYDLEVTIASLVAGDEEE